ncbi:MAG: ATP-binding protein [Clostridia bacterium]
MLYPFAISLYVFFIMGSSIWLERTVHPVMTVLAALLFLASVLLERRARSMRTVQIILLAGLHLVSQINWCHPLYLILTAREYQQTRELKRSIGIAILYFAIYSFIRISYSPPTSYNLLVTISDLFSSLFVIGIIFVFLHMDNQKRQLEKETRRLVSEDVLTGLINFSEFHRQLEELTKGSGRFALFLLDCYDLKSVNFEIGYTGGNLILIRLANYLRQIFPEALLVARCGGDDFALVVPVDEQGRSLSYYKGLLDEEIARELGVPLLYGESVFPEEGRTGIEVISAAERKLFSVKRNLWLQREEHLLRAEKLRVVGELAAGMAHEIRNPMTTVKGFLQIAKENSYNIKPYYEILMNEVERVSELTSELLQFSKPHSGDVRTIHLSDCVQRVVSLAESEALFYGHLIEYQSDGREVYVHMDKDKLVQVLLNLIKNAFDAMHEPGVVSLLVHQTEEYGIIEIRDTGIGIPEDELKQIFNPFFTTKETGTGLGLSICHKIMNDHGGYIEVESREKQGTKFCLGMPLASGSQQIG